MRPPRIIILVAFSLSALFTICISLRSRNAHTITTTSTEPQNSRLRALFSLRAPFSLFPPNAVITLTHDNTTAFLARPAAFGPLLPANGLKGQLWIGSGFGDDSLRQGGVASTSEGELGCSDVPGYIDGTKSAANKGASVKPAEAKPVTQSTKSKDSKDSIDKDAILNEDGPLTDKASTKSTTDTAIDDGTDDYLYLSSTQTKASKSSDKLGTNTISDHADIQSLQEGAEIAGKVVLLSRGGCGFLEKVKWAQRRGAIALIVGDDVMGGPLIQMYARGDTSNVTIPAIFTSHTTAHLLSSLMGIDAFLEDLVDENGKPAIATQSKDKAKKGNKKLLNGGITQDAASKKATRGVTKISSKSTSAGSEAAPMNTQKPGWFSSWFFGSKGSKSDDRRPPSSGQLDWSLPNEAKEVDATSKKPSKSNEKDNTAKKPKEKTYTAKQAHGDDFQIGVQDWRDPDLVGSSKSSSKDKGSANDHKLPSTKAEEKLEAENAKTGASKLSSAGKKIKGNVQQDQSDHLQDLKGGSIVPSSGEYEVKSKDADKSSTKESQKDTSIVRPQSTGLWAKLFGSKHEEEVASPSSSSTTPSMEEQEAEISEEEDEMEGLWVTLTPTSGASPFLDTLLVLVVSPLVTLTVVYALLLIRSRIRRRRWRAPKSVVERLPVRTYQTIQTPGNRSPRLPPSPTAATVSTPLLQRGGNSRPRSRTTTGIPDSDLAMSTPLSVPIISPHVKEHESPISTSSEWRKFMGRQVECVVCLEEYIDGVSRVMSLPCGHEFHVDCITPWLTTRRRTCPICKGDVVRSLARGSPSSPQYESYHSDSEDDEDHHHRHLDEPDLGMEEDVERGTGTASPTPRRREQSNIYGSSWRNVLASSLGSLSRSPRQGSGSGNANGNGNVGQDRSR